MVDTELGPENLACRIDQARGIECRLRSLRCGCSAGAGIGIAIERDLHSGRDGQIREKGLVEASAAEGYALDCTGRIGAANGADRKESER